MKALERNKSPFYYCLYKADAPLVDEYGNESGDTIVTYYDAVLMNANVSPASGQSMTEQFGNLENYDKVIVTTDMNCPITETSVLFLDKAPEYKSVSTYVPTAVTTTVSTISVPLYDYAVRRVSKSLNSISIAVKKVAVS